jgi:putative Mg2+ transporter-C (MgtC) family protein
MDLFDTDWLAQLSIVIKVAIAMLLGGLIGLEREYARKPAGFRTHMLVAGAAALLVGLADVLVAQFALSQASPLYLRADPIRIVEAIIAGVAFLGAGTIFRSGQGKNMEGLTTAASILLAAGVGIAVALEQILTALGVTILGLVVLRFVRIADPHHRDSAG